MMGQQTRVMRNRLFMKMKTVCAGTKCRSLSTAIICSLALANSGYAQDDEIYTGVGNGNNFRFKIQIEDAGQNPRGDWTFLSSADSDGNQAGFQGDGYYLYGEEDGITNNLAPVANETMTFQIFIPEGATGTYQVVFVPPAITRSSAPSTSIHSTG